jgi:N-acetylmuramoyl-L-alanine amidase
MIGATDAASKELEALENQSAVGEESLDGDLADLPFAVDLIQTDTLKRSSLLAEVLLNELGDDGLATTRGVKQANFVVLRSIRVPSVLVELGFLSNANDADALRSVQHREALGKSLARGLVDFRSRFARHSPAP